ncbi:hypothetical protein ACNS7O_03055 [Haloferacaceae archaeon DSL9]
MVEDRLRDGKRIAQLLASELDADERRLAAVTLVEADPDVEPTADGAFAYGVALATDDGETTRIADVFVQPDRARVEFRVTPDVAADAAADAELRVRPKAVDPPRTLVFVEDGAQVKWIGPVFVSVVEAVET